LSPFCFWETARIATRLLHGQCLFEAGQDVGWDQWRFAAPAHHQFSTFPYGGPALEASWSHPTLKKPFALASTARLIATANSIVHNQVFAPHNLNIDATLR